MASRIPVVSSNPSADFRRASADLRACLRNREVSADAKLIGQHDKLIDILVSVPAFDLRPDALDVVEAAKAVITFSRDALVKGGVSQGERNAAAYDIEFHSKRVMNAASI